MEWFATHHRPMPWKGERNPYLVWLSEVILQQTRVEQGLPYFEKFREKYPNVQSLAAAPEDELMKLWEGLGYYSRARNLHFTAKHIAGESGGKFPDTYAGIRSLKGVGDYTAAAIASFAYDLPHAVLDGNVFRVLARYFGISEPTDTTEGKKRFASLAQSLLDHSQPGNYNQAIMDFGATQCTAAAPRCPACPLRPQCVAFSEQKTAFFPVKIKRPERRERFFNYLIISQKEFVFIKKRTEKDIWQNLYDFPLIETPAMMEGAGSLDWPAWLGNDDCRLRSVSPPLKQELTHRRVIARFWEIEAGEGFSAPETTWVRVERSKLREFAFPKIIDLYFQQNFLPFDLL